MRRTGPHETAGKATRLVLTAGCLLAVDASFAGATDTRRPPIAIVGDAIPAPLTDTPGDPARGRAIIADRTRGLCLLCHAGPIPEERFQGDLGPDLSGAGSRHTAGQLRLRLVDGRALNPDTIMPSYHRVDPSPRVGAAWRGKPVLEAQEIEDVVAYLATLRDDTREGPAR
ncbi:sulfur oxidation c-type cytochrome SoxX [Methylobacterium sp. Leaf399]|uniref:sulfur oxidation c-type cytochrome SoxX n=1 Tax=Methylobacterium sp. Leaf399 TaxID=1736364 RepID=UPI000A5C75A7